MKKLTEAQKSTLYDAARRYGNTGTGWFYPSRYELTDVYTTKATCRALCGKGYLEYRTFDYSKVKGEWVPDNEYRITQQGLQWVRENPISFSRVK